MNEYADLVAAPLRVTAQGKVWEVSPFTDGDFGSFMRTVQFQDWYSVCAIPDVPQAVKDATLKDCIKKTITMDDDFDAAARTHWGQNELAFLSLHHRHPDFKREDLLAWRQDEVGQVAALAIMLTRVATGGMDDEKKKAVMEMVAKLRESGRVI